MGVPGLRPVIGGAFLVFLPAKLLDFLISGVERIGVLCLVWKSSDVSDPGSESSQCVSVKDVPNGLSLDVLESMY